MLTYIKRKWGSFFGNPKSYLDRSYVFALQLAPQLGIPVQLIDSLSEGRLALPGAHAASSFCIRNRLL